MSLQNRKTSQSASLRAKQLKKVINQLKRKIKKIEREGEVAPPNCHLIRVPSYTKSENLLVL